MQLVAQLQVLLLELVPVSNSININSFICFRFLVLLHWFGTSLDQMLLAG